MGAGSSYKHREKSFCFFSAEDGTQGLVHARHVLYHRDTPNAYTSLSVKYKPTFKLQKQPHSRVYLRKRI
jgi:hypothetical protein